MTHQGRYKTLNPAKHPPSYISRKSYRCFYHSPHKSCETNFCTIISVLDCKNRMCYLDIPRMYKLPARVADAASKINMSLNVGAVLFFARYSDPKSVCFYNPI